MKNRKPIHVLGACLDLGAGRRGVDMGASAIRLAGLSEKLRGLGYTVNDEGNLNAPDPESGPYGDAKAKFLKEITQFSEALSQKVLELVDANTVPLILGGDHTVAIGSISGAAASLRKQNKSLGVLWVDAHVDMNTPETSPSGNIHGMPMAVLLGRGPKELCAIAGDGPKVDPSKVAFVGIRSVDPREAEYVKESGVFVATMRDIDERGIKSVMDEALNIITGGGNNDFWVSWDMDGCDPQIAPGVGTPVSGGISRRESHLIMEMVCDSGRLMGMDLVEINPILDVSNVTAQFAVDIAQSAFGKKIL